MNLLKIICICLVVGILQCGENTAAEKVAGVLSKAILNALKDPTKFCQKMKYDWEMDDFSVVGISMVPSSDNNREWVGVVDTGEKGIIVVTSSNGPCGVWNYKSWIKIPDTGHSHLNNTLPYLYRYKDAPDSMQPYWLAYINDESLRLCGYKDLATLISDEQTEKVCFIVDTKNSGYLDWDRFTGVRLGPKVAPMIYNIRGHTIWIHFAFTEIDSQYPRVARGVVTVWPKLLQNPPFWNRTKTRFLINDNSALRTAHETLGISESFIYGDWF
jgi:hypothetical protein